MGTEMQAQIGSMLEEYRALRSRIETASAELTAMTATARSSDRMVTATVNQQGELVGLRIDSALAARLDLNTLTGRILEASRLAAAEIRGQLGAKMSDVMPGRLRHLIRPDGTVDLGGLLPKEPDGIHWPGER